MTIHCVLRGHEYRNEVQVTAQVFFPGAKFAFVEEVPPQGFAVESFFDAGGNAVAVLYEAGEVVATGGYGFETNVTPPARVHGVAPRAHGRAVMLSIFHALKKAVPTFTPWGALTGIRPSKLVREWLAAGCADGEIIARLAEPYCVSEEKARLALAVAHAENRVATKIGDTAALYVSIPFCPSRCVYCSFNVAGKPASAELLERYTHALVGEIREKAARVRGAGVRISSVYIGGGSPAILSEELLERVLAAICENFPDETGREFTVEAGRPDTLTAAKLKILQKYGVNRIAVNPQTLNDRTLTKIGRSHTARDFFRAFALAREVGFSTINCDMIIGLPDETADDVKASMERLAGLSPENITLHTLAVKRASRLAENRPTFAEPHVIQEMLAEADKICAAAGLSPYYLYRQKNMAALLENVGYAKPSHECLYNVGMMAEVQTIFGMGAGAVSKFVVGDKITREFNAKDAQVYIERRKPT